MLASGDISTSQDCPAGATFPQRRLGKSVDSYGRFAPEFRIRTARDLRESLFAFSAKLRVNSMKLRVHLIALPPRRTGGGRALT